MNFTCFRFDGKNGKGIEPIVGAFVYPTGIIRQGTTGEVRTAPPEEDERRAPPDALLLVEIPLLPGETISIQGPPRSQAAVAGRETWRTETPFRRLIRFAPGATITILVETVTGRRISTRLEWDNEQFIVVGETSEESHG